MDPTNLRAVTELETILADDVYAVDADLWIVWE